MWPWAVFMMLISNCFLFLFCSCVCGGGGSVFQYDALCGLFGWNCALHVYRISYLS